MKRTNSQILAALLALLLILAAACAPGDNGARSASTPPQITATLRADPELHQGQCPAKIDLIGVITTDRPCQLRYRFVFGDGRDDPPRSLYFGGAGSQKVTTSLGVDMSSFNWARLEVLEPVRVSSPRSEFAVQCLLPGQKPGDAGYGSADFPRLNLPGQEGQASPGAWGGRETCRKFSWQSARLTEVRSEYRLRSKGVWIFDCGRDLKLANQALAVIKTYKMDRVCQVGGKETGFIYMLSRGVAPVGSMDGENCLLIDPETVLAKQVDGVWRLVDGATVLAWNFGSDKDSAMRAAAAIKRYGFTHACQVGGGSSAFRYLRR